MTIQGTVLIPDDGGRAVERMAKNAGVGVWRTASDSILQIYRRKSVREPGK